MAINAYGQNTAIYGNTPTKSTENVKDKTALNNSDFMTLLLVELQNQDPTEPMDSQTILTQTSQLATLESSDNTNNALAELANSLGSNDQFSTIAAIGKRADLGSDGIAHESGSTSKFEIYFPEDIKAGTVEITDTDENIVGEIDISMKDSDGNIIEQRDAGVYQFDWDGLNPKGNVIESGSYHVNASYITPAGDKLSTRLGAYPIESVKFDKGEAYLKLGSSYVPISSVQEIY